MSISGVSVNSLLAQSQDTVRGVVNQWRQGLSQLSGDIQSGDLDAARSDFQSLVKLHQSNPLVRPAGSGNETLQTDFQSIGQALSSGDLDAAQSAFSQLQTDMQAAKTQFQSHHCHPDVAAPTEAPDGDSTSAVNVYA